MTSHYRHLRSFDPAQGFPLQVEPGEIIVNTANRQLAVGDADAMSVGVPKLLIAVRFFDATAQYAINDIVAQNGNVYRANSSIPPGAFNGANWTQLGAGTAGSIAFTPGGSVAATDVQAAIAEVASDYAAADAVLTTSVNGKVAKAGDTMTGNLTLPLGTVGSLPLQFTGATTTGFYASTTFLSLVVNGTVRGQFGTSALRGGDGNVSTPAFSFLNEPASGYYRKTTGDIRMSSNGIDVMAWNTSKVTTAFGAIALPADPVNPLEASTKQYVDNKVAAAAPVAATAAEYISNSAPTKMLTPGAAWSAAMYVAVTPSGSTFTPDMNAGLDFNLALSAAGMTLANPTNQKIGQKGVIYFSQDATGGRTITTWGSAYKFPGGVKPTLSTAPNSLDAVSYVVAGIGFVACTFSAGFA